MWQEREAERFSNMAQFGGKKVGQMVLGFGGSGLGQALAAVAAVLLLRLFSGPGPALLPDTELTDHDHDGDGDGDDVIEDKGETPVGGNVIPVTIRWRNITCSLADKSSKSVSLSFLATYLFGCRRKVFNFVILRSGFCLIT